MEILIVFISLIFIFECWLIHTWAREIKDILQIIDQHLISLKHKL